MHAIFGVELLKSGQRDKSGDVFSGSSIRQIAREVPDNIPVTLNFNSEKEVGFARGFKASSGIFYVYLYCDLHISFECISEVLGKCPCIGGKVEEISDLNGRVLKFRITEVGMAVRNRDKTIGRLEITQTGKRR